MPEDEKGTEGEDLFEDLDKFFAPIQDVDWPESSEGTGSGTGSGTAQGADRSDEPAPAEPQPAEPSSPSANQMPREARRWRSRLQPEDHDAEEADAQEPATAQPSGGGELFTAPETPSDAEVEPKVEEEQDGVGSVPVRVRGGGLLTSTEAAGEAGSGGYRRPPRRRAGGRRADRGDGGRRGGPGHRGRRGRGRSLRRVRPRRGAGRTRGAGPAAHRGSRDRAAPR